MRVHSDCPPTHAQDPREREAVEEAETQSLRFSVQTLDGRVFEDDDHHGSDSEDGYGDEDDDGDEGFYSENVLVGTTDHGGVRPTFMTPTHDPSRTDEGSPGGAGEESRRGARGGANYSAQWMQTLKRWRPKGDPGEEVGMSDHEEGSRRFDRTCARRKALASVLKRLRAAVGSQDGGLNRVEVRLPYDPALSSAESSASNVVSSRMRVYRYVSSSEKVFETRDPAISQIRAGPAVIVTFARTERKILRADRTRAGKGGSRRLPFLARTLSQPVGFTHMCLYELMIPADTVCFTQLGR